MIAKNYQQSAEAINYHVQWFKHGCYSTGISKRYYVDTSKKECSCGFY